MKLKTMVAAALCGCMLAGCVSEYTKREYAQWRQSEDAVASVSIDEFESKYMNGWRDRAQAKSLEKRRVRQYREWQKSKDGVAGTSFEEFKAKYMDAWVAKVQQEYKDRQDYAEWQKSEDGVEGATFEEFVSKYKTGWRERVEQKKQARLAKEAKEREERLAKEAREREIARRKAAAAELRRKRDGWIAGIASAYLKAIRAQYADGDKYVCPFPRKSDRNADWLRTWTEPRLDLSEEDKLAGEALLAEFGTKYLPNAYENYEKVKDRSAELQQVFNEEFPEPWAIKETNPKWHAFNKVLEKFAKVRTEFFLCHDELCHYWLMWRLGVMSEAELAEADAQPLAVRLLPENVARAGYEFVRVVPMEGKIADFAAKYAPESSAVYQNLAREFKELNTLLREVFQQHKQMDDVRFDRVLAAAVDKRNAIVREMNALSQNLQAWHMDHRTMEKSSEDVAKCDHAAALQLKPFVESLPGYIKNKMCGRVIPASDMIAIPGKNYKMQRTEVTQRQWMAVMGNNPSRFKGPDRPVENVSWDDCQEFIRRVSVMDGVPYRLPTEAEWEYACRAGSTGNWGRRKNGEEGPLDVMGWYCGNSGRSTHPVAQKEPNAWGLYDMHGNVWEWCEDLYRTGGANRVRRGGGWGSYADYCAAGYRDCGNPDGRDCDLGFRLASPMD